VKKDGRVRYIGVQAVSGHQYEKLGSIMKSEPIDFIGVDYAVDNRGVEQTILPLALERKIGVLAYFPSAATPGGKVTSSLIQRAGDTLLPDWAADFDAKTWGQFFLKYVVSHPAVTVVRAGTSQRSTCWTTSPPASAASQTKRREGAWQSWSTPGCRLRVPAAERSVSSSVTAQSPQCRPGPRPSRPRCCPR
jgi:predicted aldo/keto reductase-like oxidoreductase